MILALDKDRRKNNHISRHGVFYVTVSRPTKPELLHFSTSDFTEIYFENTHMQIHIFLLRKTRFQKIEPSFG